MTELVTDKKRVTQGTGEVLDAYKNDIFPIVVKNNRGQTLYKEERPKDPSSSERNWVRYEYDSQGRETVHESSTGLVRTQEWYPTSGPASPPRFAHRKSIRVKNEEGDVYTQAWDKHGRPTLICDKSGAQHEIHWSKQVRAELITFKNALSSAWHYTEHVRHPEHGIGSFRRSRSCVRSYTGKDDKGTRQYFGLKLPID